MHKHFPHNICNLLTKVIQSTDNSPIKFVILPTVRGVRPVYYTMFMSLYYEMQNPPLWKWKQQAQTWDVVVSHDNS